MPLSANDTKGFGSGLGLLYVRTAVTKLMALKETYIFLPSFLSMQGKISVALDCAVFILEPYES